MTTPITYADLVARKRAHTERPVAGFISAETRGTGYAHTRPIALQNTVGSEIMSIASAKALVADLQAAITLATWEEVEGTRARILATTED